MSGAAVPHFKHIEQTWFELTVKHLVPGDEGHPHTLAAVFHQVLKVQFALLDEVLLHLRRAAGVSLRTEAQVLTCGGENRWHQFHCWRSGLSDELSLWSKLSPTTLAKRTRLEPIGRIIFVLFEALLRQSMYLCEPSAALMHITETHTQSIR